MVIHYVDRLGGIVSRPEKIDSNGIRGELGESGRNGYRWVQRGEGAVFRGVGGIR